MEEREINMNKVKKKYKVISLIVVQILLFTILGYSLSARGENLSFDFEDGYTHFNNLYDNAQLECLSENNGNKYLKLTFSKGGDRRNFDVSVTSSLRIGESRRLQVNYDVMYPEFTTDRTGEMHIKERVGPGSAETTMVARVSQVNGFFQVQGGNGQGFQRIKGLNGQYLQMEENHWYSVKMIVDLQKHTQYTYIFDRDTENLLAVHQEITTVNEVVPNVVSFSSSASMCLDNVRIFEPSCEGGCIYGTPYLKKGNKATYHFLAKNSEDSITEWTQGTTKWSIVNEKTGVSIDENSGRVTTYSSVEPGYLIIKAERSIDDTVYEDKFAVSIID